MKVTIAAIGRLKAGAERDLLDRFLGRADAAGRRLGLQFSVREFPEGRAADAATRKTQESAALVGGLPKAAVLVVLDEHGKSIDSRALANRLAAWRDSGVEDVAFLIGGPDGLDMGAVGDAAFRLAFGPMTWPHQLVRLMLAEQLYRSVTILSGHPYHRD